MGQAHQDRPGASTDQGEAFATAGGRASPAATPAGADPVAWARGRCRECPRPIGFRRSLTCSTRCARDRKSRLQRGRRHAARRGER